MSENAKIGRSEIGERIHFQITPEILDRIEFRGVGREQEGIKTGRAFEERGDFAAPVGLESIPNEHDRCLKLPT